jgi:signal transduction histidine kinase
MQPSSPLERIAPEGARSPAPLRAAGAHHRGAPSAATGSFDLLRWFSIASLLALVPVTAGIGALISHFIAEQILNRDALLTAQFLQNSIRVESADLGGASLLPYLDPRADPAAAGLDRALVAHGRAEVFQLLETIPDALLVNVYARDRMVIWSTSKGLVRTYSRGDKELDEAFAPGAAPSHHYGDEISVRHDAQFRIRPREFFVENYVPLQDGRGQVVAVVEIYKEPGGVMASIRAVQVLVWVTTLLGCVVVYVGLFGIVRRGRRLLRQQQQQLVAAESQLFAGEMATALAHSLRNPLSSVRNCAELALCSADVPVRKNAQDIITQVDFLSQWIRELLLYSRPLVGETESVDLQAILHSVLASFGPTFERLGIRVAWQREGTGRILAQGNTALARQALHSVVSNAVEAMPGGGEMRVELRRTSDPAGVDVIISDTGVGMSEQQLASAFRPFQTTKPHGLGVGLPMLRRAMERFGGFVMLASVENAGTQVRLHFRTGGTT